MDATLTAVVHAWRSSPGTEFRRPLDEDGLLAAEARLGRPFPTMLRQLYEVSDGLSAFGGSLSIEPALVASDLAEDLRDSEWQIAPELLIFGGDGTGGRFGLWYPAGSPPDGAHPVIEIGEIFDEQGNMAIVGTSLPTFLRTWTAVLLVTVGGTAASMHALGLPKALRKPGRHARWAPFVAWSDPVLPHADPDPYIQRLDREQVAGLVAQLRRM